MRPYLRGMGYAFNPAGAHRRTHTSVERAFADLSLVVRDMAAAKSVGSEVDAVTHDHGRRSAPLGSVLRRAIDIVVALSLLVLLAPLLAVVAIAIHLTDRGPVLFRQRRVGTDGPFLVYKFRTMRVNALEHPPDLRSLIAAYQLNDGPLFKVMRDPRITRIGLLLRRCGSDELPQLFNVLNGTMTLVGPRPILEVEARALSADNVTIFSVKPGLTGAWLRKDLDPRLPSVSRLDRSRTPNSVVQSVQEGDSILTGILTQARAANRRLA